jgi:hypothetical protein
MNPQPNPPRRTRLRRIAIFVGLCAVAAAFLPSITKHRPGELAVSLEAAGRMARGEEIYVPPEGKAFTYPPLFAVPFVPLGALGEHAARSVWYFVNLLLAGASVSLIARQVRSLVAEHRDRAPAWVLVLLVAALGGRFLVSPIEYQGHDLVVFVLVLLSIATWDSPRRWASGFWGGTAAACKATPLLLLPLFLWERRLAAACSFALAAALGALLPDLIFPRADGGLWIVSWYENFVSKVEPGVAADAQGAWVSWNILNQSLPGTLHRLFTSLPPGSESVERFDVCLVELGPGTLRAVILLLEACVLVVLAVVWRPGRLRGMPLAERRFSRLGLGAMALCAMLLLSPMSSKAHFCVLLAPVAVLSAAYLHIERDAFTLAAIASLFVLGPLSAKDIIGRPVANTILAYGGLTLATLICFAATARVVVRESRRQRDAITAPARA